jgi:hypothetical protein
MGGAVFDGSLCVSVYNKPVNQTECKAVPTADAVQYFKVFPRGREMKFAPCSADGAPVVAAGRLNCTKCRGGDFEIEKRRNRLFDHSFKAVNGKPGEIFVHPVYFETQTGTEVFFIAKHDIDKRRQTMVDFSGLVLAPQANP